MFSTIDPKTNSTRLEMFTVDEFEKALPPYACALRETQDIVVKYGLGGWMRYGFVFPREIDVIKLERIMNHYQFPHDVRWYEANGVKIFDLKAGDELSGKIIYLIAS